MKRNTEDDSVHQGSFEILHPDLCECGPMPPPGGGGAAGGGGVVH